MLEVKSVKKSYDRVLFQKLNLVFPSTGMVLITGKSGCGKSTFLNCLGGLDYFDEGHVYYNSKLIEKKNFDEFRKEHICYLFQDFVLLEQESIYENLQIANELNRKKKSKEEVIALLKQFNLNKNLNEKCKNLSGGEKQRLSLIRALINDKDIILCDEPTAALDEDNSRILLDFLKQISSSHLIVIVSHNEKLLAGYCDFHYNLNNYKKIKIEHKDGFILSKQLTNPSISCLIKIMLKEIKYNFGKISLSILSFSFVFLIALLCLSFAFSIFPSVTNLTKNYFDYNILRVEESYKEEINDLISFNKASRPSFIELSSLLQEGDRIFYSLDGVINKGHIKNGDKYLDILFKPAFFESSSPSEVYLNQLANELFTDGYFELEFTLLSEGEGYLRAKDNVYFRLNLTKVAVIEEFSFLLTPVIYYSYSAFQKMFSEYVLPSASKLFNKNISLFERIINAKEDEDISDYSLLIYSDDPSYLYDYFNSSNRFAATSIALDTEKNLLDIFSSLTTLLTLFVVIAFIISLVLVILALYSLIISHQKDIALLKIIGYSDKDIQKVFIFLGEMIIFLSVFLSIITYSFSLNLLNKILNNYFEANLILNINNFLDIFDYFLTFILALTIGLLISLFSLMSLKKIKLTDSLREEV